MLFLLLINFESTSDTKLSDAQVFYYVTSNSLHGKILEITRTLEVMYA